MTHRTDLAQLLDHLVNVPPHQTGMNRHRDVHLARRDEVDDDPKAVERAENASEEPMRDGLPVRVDVDDDNVVLDRHRCREVLGESLDGSGGRCEVGRLGRRRRVRLRVDDRSSSERVLDVLDPDGNLGADNLLHGEGVNDLAAVVG